MLSRSRSKERSSSRKVTPPSPSYMSSDQFAAYLANLRDNRQTRPAGARPPPSSTTLPRRDSALTAASAPAAPASATPSVAATPVVSQVPTRNTSRAPSQDRKPIGRPSMAGSMASRYSTMTSTTAVSSRTARDYYPDKSVAPVKAGEVLPSATYIERGQRWMEKEEVVSLRQAMDDMEVKDQKSPDEGSDEDRLYNAALDEAAELVWQHQHGVKPPEPGAPYAYKSHLRRDSYAHARAASAGRYGEDVAPTGLARDRSVSHSSSASEGTATPENEQDERPSTEQQRRPSLESTNSKSYGSVGRATRRTSGSHRRRSSLKRNISGEIQKPFSGDQIWEEPESNASERKLSSVQSVQSAATAEPAEPLQPTKGNPTAPTTASAPPSASKLWSRREIHKNPPTQSRNAGYTTNSPFDRRKKQQAQQQDDIPMKNGIEIRSDDIRQATSMSLRDRSAKLPTPSAVSDAPGRPIVSFDKNWKAPEESADSRPSEVAQVANPKPIPLRVGQDPQSQQQQASKPPSPPPVPSITVTPTINAPSQPAPRPKVPAVATAIPSISVECDTGPSIPTIMVGDDDTPASIPTIVLPGDEDDMSSGGGGGGGSMPSIPMIITPDGNDTTTPQPPANRGSARPLPTPTKRTVPVGQTSRNIWDERRRSHWSPAPVAGNRVTATCHECRYPIEGKVVALAGTQERFHPQCFRCYTCGTRLEALEISPEPDHFRSARIDRIRRRAAGEILDENPGQTMGEDGDERLRFFCHLDWHEHFAPRCKHCTTTILGEHIVALGEHWHYGHFFCAECGDPFTQGMTHIEKDGYAWCVNCQTKRTERRAPKCKRCKKAVIGQYIQALGGEWHDECFRCADCGGGFDDGQIFPVSRRGGDVVLCTGCRACELKM